MSFYQKTHAIACAKTARHNWNDEHLSAGIESDENGSFEKVCICLIFLGQFTLHM